MKTSLVLTALFAVIPTPSCGTALSARDARRLAESESLLVAIGAQGQGALADVHCVLVSAGSPDHPTATTIVREVDCSRIGR